MKKIGDKGLALRVRYNVLTEVGWKLHDRLHLKQFCQQVRRSDSHKPRKQHQRVEYLLEVR